ncbi:MAG: GxxExxY protein [Gemmatimonadota bacterium]|nr:GxxExxY protein [Gemmatimonadota bacterium]MDE3214900.1 GxxExxY protein [Gemmatimonadota bacterium]
MGSDLKEAETTNAVIGAFYDVYNALGYGFLEGLYLEALERELVARGHRVGREVHVPVFYHGAELGRQRLDMVVDEKVVVEAKATEALHPIATRQLFAYLRAIRLEVGLLLHFGPRPRFRRVVCLNRPDPDANPGSGY